MLAVGGTLSISSLCIRCIGILCIGIRSFGILCIGICCVGIRRIGIRPIGIRCVGVVVVLPSGVDLLLGQGLAGVGQGRSGGLNSGGCSGRLLDGGFFKDCTVAGGRRAAIIRSQS